MIVFWKGIQFLIYFYAKEQLLLAPLKYLTSGEVSSVNFYFVKTPSKEEWRTLISDLKKPSNSLHEYPISATDWRTDIFRNRITWTFIAEKMKKMKVIQNFTLIFNNFSKKLAEKRYETFFDMFSWLVWPRLPRYDDQNILFWFARRRLPKSLKVLN